mmetsp:Transcript_9781/g.33633  ORF Transcript_9781/g.33633 Transcript_9781/m.33633 type:complete len:273 (-) Transcript_9781:292-1110(-)
MQAWAVGSDPSLRCAPDESVNGCLPPLRPTRCAKPPTGTRRDPVANWSSPWSRRLSGGAPPAHLSTTAQNQRTSRASARRPPASRVCLRQSPTSTSRRPLSKRPKSSALSIFRASTNTSRGTALRSPLAMASSGSRRLFRRRQSRMARTKSWRFDASTSRAAPPAQSSTAEPGASGASPSVKTSRSSETTRGAPRGGGASGASVASDASSRPGRSGSSTTRASVKSRHRPATSFASSEIHRSDRSRSGSSASNSSESSRSGSSPSFKSASQT